MQTQIKNLLHSFWGGVQCFFNHHDMGKWHHLVARYYMRRCKRCGAKEIGKLNKNTTNQQVINNRDKYNVFNPHNDTDTGMFV